MTMGNADACEIIARHRPPDAVVISTMTTLRNFPPRSPSQLNLSCVPLMGGASALGLGIALARSDRPVIVLDGDGSLLMQLGSLATVAGAGAQNLIHFVFDNGVWFEGGADFPLPAASHLDWVGMADAAGYASVRSISQTSVLDEELPGILSQPGPNFIRLGIEVGGASDRTPWSRENPQSETPDFQFVRMGEEARAVKGALAAVPNPQMAIPATTGAQQ